MRKVVVKKIDIGCVSTRLNESDIDKIKPVLRDVGVTRIPTHYTDIYKCRRGRYKGIRIWSYIDLGTMRKQDLFITDSRLEPINDFFDGFDVEAVTSDWEDGVMAELNQFLTELNNKLKEG